MVSDIDLLENAKTRFKEAKVLHANAFYDGAFYLCGYALEFVLKRNIAKKLNWDGFPPDRLNKADTLFKIHDLEQLLILSGLNKDIFGDDELLANWQKASQWSAEMRYTRVGSITSAQSNEIIKSFKILLNFVSSKHP